MRRRLTGCLLADPTAGAEAGCAAMDELAADGCFRFVRFNPYLFPGAPADGAGGMAGAVGRALYRRAGELSLPVGVMAFRGVLPLEADILALMRDSPRTAMVLDHFGFAGAAAPADASAPCDTEEWRAVGRIMRASANAYLKLSALDRQAGLLAPGPEGRYAGVQALVRDAVESFGADRLMFGTDFPFVDDEGNAQYGAARRVVESTPGLSASDVEMIMGGTICRLLPGAFAGQ